MYLCAVSVDLLSDVLSRMSSHYNYFCAVSVDLPSDVLSMVARQCMFVL